MSAWCSEHWFLTAWIIAFAIYAIDNMWNNLMRVLMVWRIKK